MSQDPRVPADTSERVAAENHEPANHATDFFSPHPKLTEVAHALAAHGGGEVSVDLAFDLVLNEVVDQARNATGGTGAAIALFRDGELTCRATSGENAPDLGVRVDSSSGLAGACVSTGEMQQCRDTETDARVNAEACRRLGVRSMLIAPLVDRERLIGIIQVFSAWPNAFGKREISALQVLAGRIAESNREAETAVLAPEPKSEQVSSNQVTDAPSQPPSREEGGDEHLPAEGNGPKAVDVWGAVLVVLVISSAILLGLVIGWGRAAKHVSGAVTLKPAAAPAAQESSAGTPSSVASTSESSANAPETSQTSDSNVSKTTASFVPSGGLLVTQNGKVIYPSTKAAGAAIPTRRLQRSLIHRVEPEYPAEARARQVQGAVVLDVQILGTGAVGTVGLVSGDPLLAQSAIAAVKQWRYQPDVVNGHEIESQVRITVRFTLPAS